MVAPVGFEPTSAGFFHSKAQCFSQMTKARYPWPLDDGAIQLISDISDYLNIV